MTQTEPDLRERRATEGLLNAKLPVNETGTESGRHRSSVYRGIRRNCFPAPGRPEQDGHDEESPTHRRHAKAMCDPPQPAVRHHEGDAGFLN